MQVTHSSADVRGPGEQAMTQVVYCARVVRDRAGVAPSAEQTRGTIRPEMFSEISSFTIRRYGQPA